MSPSPVPARSFPSVVIAELSLNFSVFINQYRQTVAILQLVPGPISLSWRNARVVTPLLHTEMSVPPYTGCLYYTVSPSLLPCALSFCPDSGLLLPGWVPPVNVYCWCLFFFSPNSLRTVSVNAWSSFQSAVQSAKCVFVCCLPLSSFPMCV